MKATEHLDLEKIIITSPALGMVTYSLMDAYRIIVVHEARHFQQAKRVTEEKASRISHKRHKSTKRSGRRFVLFCAFLWHSHVMEIKRINTPDAPQPAGHYSQATVYNGLFFVGRQLSIDPATGEKKLGSIEEQTEQALSNVQRNPQGRRAAIGPRAQNEHLERRQ
jgi:hypothetical protein